MLRLLLLTAVTSLKVVRINCTTASTSAITMQAVDFEIFGSVQGVFFRKYTKTQAQKLELRGWCKNTSQGTVLGHMQGPSVKLQEMMHWLQYTGSPSSKIALAEFKNKKDISEYTFNDFSIVKD